MKYLVTLALAAFYSHAHANLNNCLQGKFPFFQNYARYSTSWLSKTLALETACEEINKPEFHDPNNIAERVGYGLIANVSTGMMGAAVASFSTLQGTEAGRHYMNILTTIKQIPNPVERVRRVYELAVMHSGDYDERNGNPTWLSGLMVGAHRPENLLANYHRRGTVGVCREFAALLKWSLQQVSRHSTSTNGALAATDFSSSFMAGSLPGERGWETPIPHAWIRVNIPVVRAGRLVDFTHFDLDTTWYPRFTPLFPRRSGLSVANQTRAKRECQEILACLQRIY